MKKFRFWLFLTAIIFSFSCSKDPGVETPDPETSDASGHKVAISAALSELQSVLSGIDGETRSGSSRRVGSVLSVKGSDVLPETRSGEDLNVEDLVYIANFENGEGYAVLGADDRLASVIAITDQGSLTAEEFAAAARGEYDDVDAPPVWPVIAKSVVQPFGPVINIRYKYGPWQPLERIWPTVLVKWGQWYPYNYYTPKVNGEETPAGCSAVAVGQIVTSNLYRTRTTYGGLIGGYAIDWMPIFSIIDYIRDHPTYPRIISSTSSRLFDYNISKLLHGIGVSINTNYQIDGSGTDISYAKSFLDKIGYRNVRLIDFSEAEALAMLRQSGPFYASGVDEARWTAHAWVVDGLYRRQRLVEIVSGFGAPGSFTEYSTLLHCNIGEKGLRDGYYDISGFLDLTVHPAELDEGDRGTDMPCDREYSLHVQMITYSGF